VRWAFLGGAVMLLVGVILMFGVAIPAVDHPYPSITVTGTVTKAGYQELCEQSGSPVAADMGVCPAYTLAVDGGSNPEIYPPGQSITVVGASAGGQRMGEHVSVVFDSPKIWIGQLLVIFGGFPIVVGLGVLLVCVLYRRPTDTPRQDGGDEMRVFRVRRRPVAGPHHRQPVRGGRSAPGVVAADRRWTTAVRTHRRPPHLPRRGRRDLQGGPFLDATG